MALFWKLTEDSRKTFECSICAEVFKEPRALPCLHTFCLGCLRDQGSHLDKNPGDTMPCPICRKEYVIPQEGFAALPKNFLISKLIEDIQLHDTIEREAPCDVCKVNKRVEPAQLLPATSYCLQCQQKLCDQCSKDHVVEKVGMNHKTVALESNTKAKEWNLLESVGKGGHCQQHPEKQLDIYCQNCASLICRSCVGERHHSHNCTAARLAAEEIQLVIGYEMDRISEYVKEVLFHKQQVEKLKEEFLREIEDKETAIMKEKRRDIQAERLREDLALMKHQKLKKLNVEKDEIERYLATLESFKSSYAAFRTKEMSSDIVILKFKDILEQASQLRQEHESWTQRQDLSDRAVDPNVLCDKSTKASDVMTNAVVLHTSLRLDAQLKLPMCVTGVTKLSNEIYILRYGSQSSSVYVYADQSPFQLQKEIKVEDIKCPYDIVASTKSSCLYITDKDSECIWKVTIPGHSLTEWLHQVEDPFTMSVSNDDLVLIPRCGTQSKLDLYAPNAALIHRIHLASEFGSIRHAVETQMRNYIVLVKCKEKTLSAVQQASRWTVCEVNKDGHIIRCFAADDDSQQLNNPYYLSLDMDDGLFVVDFGSHTVIQFDSDLRWRQILLSMYKNSLLKPLRLFTDQNTMQLLVGQRGGTVSVYTA